MDNQRPLRAWQAEALQLISQWLPNPTARVVIRAIMGAGKSEVIARVAQMHPGPVVVATSRVRLVKQLETQIGAGVWYGERKRPDRVTVTTYDSLETLEQPGALLICDECHRTGNARFSAAIKALNPIAQLGFTATPAKLKNWDRILYDYSAAQALKDGVVVPWVAHSWVAPSLEPTPVDDACEAMARQAVAIGPTLINATSIDDSEAFAQRLSWAGIPARAIHSRQNAKTQDEILAGLKAQIHAVVHVDMLSEGADFPWLQCLVLRRPVASKIRFAQEVGRALRAHSGKEKAHLFDPNNLLDIHRLDFEACFSGDEEPTEEEERAKAERKAKAEILRFVSSHKAMGALARLSRLAWGQMGLWPQSAIQPGRWMDMEATPKQINGLRRMAWVGRMQQAPELVDWQRKCLRALLDHATNQERYSRGEVSDIGGVLHMVANQKRLFPKECEPSMVEIADLLREADNAG